MLQNEINLHPISLEKKHEVNFISIRTKKT